MPPAVTVVIPTYDRPALLAEAVESALAQDLGDHEVVVVDDASPEPVRLAADPRLRVVRQDRNQGGAAARNIGLAEAEGRWITYLDDDDQLLPSHLDVALDGLAASTLPAPVGALTGTERVSIEGEVVGTRLPPTYPRGASFSLEEPQPGRAFATKSTLVVEVDVLRAVGGWDPAFRSRVHTELFFRLNPACSILGIPVVTYRRRDHTGPQITDDPVRREASLRQLEAKHRAAFRAHPGPHADMLFHQALRLWQGGRRRPAVHTWTRSIRAHPVRAGRSTLRAARDRGRWAADRRP